MYDTMNHEYLRCAKWTVNTTTSMRVEPIEKTNVLVHQTPTQSTTLEVSQLPIRGEEYLSSATPNGTAMFHSPADHIPQSSVHSLHPLPLRHLTAH